MTSPGRKGRGGKATNGAYRYSVQCTSFYFMYLFIYLFLRSWEVLVFWDSCRRNLKLTWQCIAMVCGQTMELAGQILELHKSHGVDEETTYKQDSSLQEEKNKKGGEWLPLIEARAFYMFSVMLTWFLTSRCFRHYRKKIQGLSFRFPSRS